MFIPASILQIPTLVKLHLARNKITSLCDNHDDSEEISSTPDSETWGCTALKVLNLSDNNLQHLPSGIQGATALTKLLLDRNDLKNFPMPWKCPLVSMKEHFTNKSICMITLYEKRRLRKFFASVVKHAFPPQKNPSSPDRRRTYDLPVTNLDALLPSYRRPVEVEAINYFHVIATNNLSATSRTEMLSVDILF